MQNNMSLSRKTLVFLLIAMLLSAALATVCAADDPNTVWKNEETGFSAVIADEAGILGIDGSRTTLLEEMKKITEYANIAVYTVSTKTTMKDYERAREKRAQLFGDADGAVFMIDMYLRRIVIQRKGNMEDYFDNATSNVITDNAASIAKSGSYYDCCIESVREMYAVINKG
ncbi:MAG: TPM domain-containing protein, partial [Clostridia bacterium]|nr:TPM domain-containing protein [Clostridia bacterium]